MREEIIIAGEPLDLDYGFRGVQLVWQSPYLTELSSIVSNRTNSISVPATVRNRRLLGYAGSQARSLFPYRRHPVIYRRDGVEMLHGTATLLSVKADTMTLCFTWGNREAFQPLFDTPLRSLADAGGEQYIYYTHLNDPTHYPYLVDCGCGRHQPALRVTDILARMETLLGVTGLSSVMVWKSLGVLLMTRIGDTHTREVQGVTLGTPGTHTEEVQYLFDMTTLTKGAGSKDYHGVMDSDGVIDLSSVSSLRVALSGVIQLNQHATASAAPVALRLMFDDGNGWDIARSVTLATPTSLPGVKLTPYEVVDNVYAAGGVGSQIALNASLSCEVHKFHVTESAYYYLSIFFSSGFTQYAVRFTDDSGTILSRELYIPGTATTYTNEVVTAPAGATILWFSCYKSRRDTMQVLSHVSEGVYYFDIDTDAAYDVSAYDAACLSVMIDVGIYPATLYGVTLASRIVPDPAEGEDALYNIGERNYPLWANLPDMSCGDFLKALMLPFGLFAYSEREGVIRFTSFAELYANRTRAVDWTDRMIEQEPDERTTVLEGFARRNLMKWKADEGVPDGILDGVIECNDDNLDAERVQYESPLSLPYGNGVPVWTYEDGDTCTFLGDDRAPRLIRSLGNATPDNVRRMVYDPGMAWPALLDSLYGEYRRTVLHPVVLKVQVLMRTADLNALDMRVPVYLRQTGHYYAIRRLTTKDSRTAEAELIELN